MNRLRREVDVSSLSSAEVKNEWNYTSAAPVCLNGANRGTFNFKLKAGLRVRRPQGVEGITKKVTAELDAVFWTRSMTRA
jgi:hypothetical protein